jgi:hypothetical protein
MQQSVHDYQVAGIISGSTCIPEDISSLLFACSRLARTRETHCEIAAAMGHVDI